MSYMKNMGQTHFPASPFIIEILWALDRSKLDPINEHSFLGETTRLMNWPDIYMKGAALRYHALDKKLSGADFEKIEGILKQSQTFLKEAGAVIELGRTQIELIKLYIEKNDQKQAKDLANVTYQMIWEIDKSLFPSDLLSLVEKDKKEIHMCQDILELRDLIGCFLGDDTFLGKIATLLTDMFGAERAAILLLERESLDEPLKIIAARNLPPEELQQFNKEPLRDLILSVIDKREPLMIADFENDRNLSQHNLPVKSLICVPTVIKGEVIGVIYIDNRLLKESFLKEDIAMITVVATVLSLSHNIPNINRKPINMNNSQTEPFYPDANESGLDLPEIIGKTESLKLALSKVKKEAGTNATVLILGETGVGKELIARALHQLSHRANNPFIVVNISALTENLLSSELFGYEKGAFTGAVKTKVGRFGIANGGTIFLDEIGDLSMDSQVKLLRVLQERTFERVGGTKQSTLTFA
jgi:transcriptional regulator with GAF, ATPase, and Fis domain